MLDDTPVINESVGRKQEHRRMVDILARNPQILRNALRLDGMWIRMTEYPLSHITKEAADMVFQDKYCSKNSLPNVTCYVMELKSDTADHEVVGQLKKAIHTLHEKGTRTGHWNTTKGVAVAKKYTASGLGLVKAEGYIPLQWVESKHGVTLRAL